MNEQCDTGKPVRHSACCPVNGKPYKAVAFNTVLHQVQKPWARELPEQGYYFCTDPDCEVVYFADDGLMLRLDELRNEVGQKSRAPDRAVCYCFDITRAEIEQHAQRTRRFVTERTREGSCDCQVRNPSGQCCLKDFPK